VERNDEEASGSSQPFTAMKRKQKSAPEIRTLECSSAFEGWKVREFLSETLYDFGSSAIGRLLKEACVLINDKAVDGGLLLKGGETVTVQIPDEELLRFRPETLPGFSVLYEDGSVIVALKPPGVGVTSDRGKLDAPFLGACVKHFLSLKTALIPRPRVVHRLDKETSGAVIVAKSRAALQNLTEQFANDEIEKEYTALVLGVPHKEEGEIDLPIGTEIRTNKLRAGGKDPKEARTTFKIVQKFRGYSLLSVKPVTGRQHQIRIHLEAVGHPLAIDRLYGGKDALMLSDFKRRYVPNRRDEERPLMDRLSLHASRIVFRSPETDEPVEVTADFPKDFRIVLKQLGKWARA
jgi:23S rRNA pseudouridine1911/1915/1917 synthase